MRLNDAAGNVRGYAKIARDATDQKLGEEALQTALETVAQSNEQLEQRVQNRTRSLAERTNQLLEMNQMRQELFRQLVVVQEQERARISRDLHDDTGQQITALLLGLSNLKSRSEMANDAGVSDLLTQLQDLAGDVAKKSHRLSFTLRPTDLDDLGMVQALRTYTEEWSQWSGLPVRLESVGFDEENNERLPAEVETTIYRVTQEALTNILRYATKNAASVSLERTATRVGVLVQVRRSGTSEVLVVVEDNGPGFDVAAVLNQPPGKRRLGIFGMQERARLAGGTLEIESTPGAGTTVSLRIPLPLL